AGELLDTGGSYPCHIIASDAGDGGERVVVCNYGEDEGVLSVFGKDESSGSSGSYARKARIPFGVGSNADPGRQEKSHAHSSVLIPPSSSGAPAEVICVDLGSDALVQFALKEDEGLTCVEKGRLSAPPGSGPRSLAFNPAHPNIAAVSLEMTAQVWLVRRDEADGSLVSAGDPISIVPEGWPDESEPEWKFNRGRWASDTVWSPDGKFMYAAARLHNSISVFRLASPEGTSLDSASKYGMELVQRISTRGITPRCLCMSPCGNVLLVAHQHSHDVTSFKRDERAGALDYVDRLEVPNAACVKLVRPERIGRLPA
ncbi:hypothetical protein ACHAWF_012693, partial [Thalassiosira exigua]